jgi:hypothetical protein
VEYTRGCKSESSCAAHQCGLAQGGIVGTARLQVSPGLWRTHITCYFHVSCSTACVLPARPTFLPGEEPTLGSFPAAPTATHASLPAPSGGLAASGPAP